MSLASWRDIFGLSRRDRPPEPEPSRPVSPYEAKEARQNRVIIAVAVVAMWLLLLFAPASSSLTWGERIGAGAMFTLLVPPLLWLRWRP